MNIEEVKSLIKFITDSGVAEVTLETAEIKLSVKRTKDSNSNDTYISTLQSQITPTLALPITTIENTTAAPQSISFKESKQVKIKSPMIGTFYSSQNPDSPPFVKVGDKIVKGQKLCVIEAMKLFNEIDSEISGTIIEILVDNSSPVEYDQELFLVDPI